MKMPMENRGFCSFVVSNNFCASPMRTIIFEELSKYKFVASGGRYANNIGSPVKDKFQFLNKYKFNIAFENSAVDGYTTEKLIDAFAANTVPIYWGNPYVSLDINPESFININDFSTFDEAIEYIKNVDEDNRLYQQYLSADPLMGNKYLSWESDLASFIKDIIDNPQKKMPMYGMGSQIHQAALSKAELYHSKALRRLLNIYKKVRH